MNSRKAPGIWHLLITPPALASWNMALDEFLFNRVAPEVPPMLRLYGWQRISLSIGYAQHLNRHIDIERCRQREIPVVRRLTGGKAVLHDQELTYSMAGSTAHFPFNLDLMGSYYELAAGFLRAFSMMGIPATLAAKNVRPGKGGPSSCFATPSAYEVLIDNKKILGSAQKRTKTAILQQGSLLLDYHPDLWNDLLLRTDNTSLEHVTALNLIQITPLSPQQVMDMIICSFEEVFHIRLEPFTLTESDLARIDALAKSNYPDLSWNSDK